MTPAEWSRIQQGIFAGESGGDYGALFGYQNRPNGRFSNVNLLDMTVDQALEFANPSGPYGQYVKGQVGRVATPMGAYQVVGTTLRGAKEGLGLTGSEKMTPELQDKIGQWIYKTQGTGAWEGYKPMTDAQAIGAETMQTLGLKPRGVLAPTQTSEAETKPMMQEEKPRGLLGSLGVQKMEEGAAGETGQRFYNRDSFKDTAAVLAQGFGRMGIMGMEEIADSVAKQRTENKARNKTAEYLRKAGRTDLADMVDQGLIGGREAASVLMQKPATGEIREIDNKLVRVMPDGSVTELYASDSPAELTADMREYNLAKEQGFTGSFIEFIQAQKGGGLQIRTNPDGTTEIIQGGPAGTKLTEGQSKATGFFARSDEANKIMADLEQEGTELRNAISGALPFGNYMRTAEGQKYDQAKRNFINAILRQESGAAIGPSEFASAELQYFPQPGDSPEVIAQKKANRATAVSALKVSAGPGAEAIGAPAPTGGATRLKFNPETGEFE